MLKAATATPQAKRSSKASSPTLIPALETVESAATDDCRVWGDCRTPQGDRGRRRVEAILDAASAIIVEEGAAALTIEAIAKHSGTSKSSMYHFFRDIDSVIDAMAQRHVDNFKRMDEEQPTEPVDWASFSLEEAVDRFTAPFRSYLTRYPDFLVVMQLASDAVRKQKRGSKVHEAQLQRAEDMVSAQLPSLKPAERKLTAATVLSVVFGTCEMMGRLPRTMHSPCLRELRQVLEAYLTSVQQRLSQR